MSIFNNIKNINNIYHNDKEIVAVYANNKLVYSNSKIEYNYFVFNVPAETTISLSTVSGNNVLEWDRVTNWGDGSSDEATSHYYAKAGTYTVKTKHVINGTQYNDGNEATRKALIKCSIGCTDRLKYLFYECSNLKEVDLTPLNKIGELSFIDMDNMFNGCYSLTSINLPTNITVSGSLNSSFSDCSSLKSIDLTYINFTNINDMSSMFYDCSSLTSINGLEAISVSSVTTFNYMFSNCISLTSLNFKTWNPRNVKYMDYMFSGCTSLSNIYNINNLNLSKLQTAYYMFQNCNSLTSLDLSYWSFDYLGMSLSFMLYGCTNLTSLNLSGWNMRGVNSYNNMFKDCSNLTYDNIIKTGCDQDTLDKLYDAYHS